MSKEIYVRDINPEDAIRWVEGKLGKLVDLEIINGVYYLRTADRDIAVVVTPNIEDGPFLSIYVNGPQIPWARSEELAIPAVRELGKTVQWCDEKTNRFMEKQGDGPAIPVDLPD